MATFREIAFRFSGEARGLEQTLRDIAEHVKRVPESKRIHIDAKTTEARRQLEEIENLVEALDLANADVKVTADIRDLAVKVATAKQIIARLPDNKTVDIKARSRIDTDLARVSSMVNRVTRDAEKLVAPMRTVTNIGEEAGFSLSGAFSQASVILRRIPPLMAGIQAVLVGALLPAIAALGAGLVGAAAAVGALGTALVAALGPAAVLAVGVFSRIQKVLQARQLQQQAANQEIRKGATAASSQAAAEERVHDASRAVTDARTQLARAEQGVTDARARARDELAKAKREEKDATKGVTEAQDNLRQATVDAGREMVDAYERASDAARDLQHAQLGVQDAKLNLRQAKLDLEEFRSKAGLASDALNKLFTKFTDVHFRFDSKGLEEFNKATGGKLNTQDQITLQRLLLGVQEAQLHVKDAVDSVSDAERESARATQDANKFRRQGIGASQGYQSALKGLADAQERERDAARDLRKLEKQGISNNQGVISALQAQTDAQNALKEAQHNLGNAHKKNVDGLSATGSAAELANQKVKQLSATEQKFLKLIDTVSKAFRNTLQPATDAVIGSLTTNLAKLAGAFGAAGSGMKGLGTTWAGVITSITNNILRPDNVIAYAQFTTAGQRLSTLFGGIFNDLYNTAVNIAQAAMPLLLKEVEKVKKAFDGWASGTENIKGVRDALTPAVTALNGFIGIITGGVEGAFLIFKDASGPINAFIGGIRDAFQNFARYAKTPKGAAQIKKFFTDTLPFVDSFIHTLGLLGKILIVALEIALPILKPILDSFNGLLSVILLLLNALNFILGPFKKLIGIAVSLVFGFGKVNKVFDLVKLGFQGFPLLLGLALRGLLDFGRKLVGPFVGAFRRIASLFRGGEVIKLAGSLGSKIFGAIKGVTRVITLPFRLAWQGIKAVFGGIGGWFDGAFRRADLVIKNALGFIVKHVGGLAGKVVEALKAPFRGIKGFIGRVFEGWLRIVRGAINRVFIDPLNFVIRQLNKIHISVPRWVPHFGGKHIGFSVGDIPHLATGGVTQGDTLARIGEAGREAVLPLHGPVLAEVARAIVSAMRVASFGAAGGVGSPLATVGGSRSAANYFDITLPPAPAAAVPDARYQAVQLGRELSRRGFG
jgi:hypothetical protein